MVLELMASRYGNPRRDTRPDICHRAVSKARLQVDQRSFEKGQTSRREWCVE